MTRPSSSGAHQRAPLAPHLRPHLRVDGQGLDRLAEIRRRRGGIAAGRRKTRYWSPETRLGPFDPIVTADSPASPSESYAAIVVGTGFASSFFLLEYLRHARPAGSYPGTRAGRPHRSGDEPQAAEQYRSALRRPDRQPHAAKALGPEHRLRRRLVLDGKHAADASQRLPHQEPVWRRRRPGRWTTTRPSLTSCGSNGRWGSPAARPGHTRAPRPTLSRASPERLRRSIGAQVPRPAHRLPSARSSSVKTGRPVCCGSGVCSVCPVSAKFQVNLHMADLYEDLARHSLLLQAEVERVEIEAGRVVGVQYRKRRRRSCAPEATWSRSVRTGS